MHARPLLRCASTAAVTSPSRLVRVSSSSSPPSSQLSPPLCCTRLIVSGRSQQSILRDQRRSLIASTPSLASHRAMSTAVTAEPKFSAGVDKTALASALEPLLASADQGGRWALISDGEGLERSFKFKTFAKTWDFMTAVALQCKLKNHHPEWSNVYNTTYIRWTTHSPPGLSAKDVELAAICDGLARDFGEVVEAPGEDTSCDLKQTADRVVANAGDCCVPKK